MKVSAGDKVFVPNEKKPYRVMARDDRYVICTKNMFGNCWYFIADLKFGWRGPDDRVFCSGYETKEMCEERLKELQAEEIYLSRRRRIPLDVDIE